jgi:MATE family multidrug resistance protein
MRNAMLWSFAVYVLVLWPLVATWGNHGLWLAFMLFMIARAITLAIYYPALERAAAAR